MLTKTFSILCVLALGVIAAPVVETRDLVVAEPRGVLPDAISLRSKWHKRDVMKAEIAARNPLPEPEPRGVLPNAISPRQVLPDAISLRSKWHKRDAMRAEIAARNPLPEPEPEPEAQAEEGTDAENFVDCCISLRSKWTAAGEPEPVEA
jgi:hypothetical protein